MYGAEIDSYPGLKNLKSAFRPDSLLLKRDAAAQLNSARSCVLGALQIADSAEAWRAQAQVRHSVIGVVEQVRRRSADPDAVTLVIDEAAINR
jgi:hypothetical protein